MGYRLAPVLRFNLIKKARLLQRLGANHGVPRFMSLSAFWTLPRIERILEHSEEKQADYLTRYLVLCAASGAMERAYWGPLVCHREGLIDDGRQPYPKLERITHYAQVSGRAENFRLRPSFHALRAFQKLLAGSTYCGSKSPTDGLEIHEFRTIKHTLHVAWTTNKRCAALIDCYGKPDLEDAEWLDRDGNVSAVMPSVLSEAPVFIRWSDNRQIELSKGAKLLKDVVIHRHQPKKHIYFRDMNLHGLVLANDAQEAAAWMKSLDTDYLKPPSGKPQSLRYARNVIWTETAPTPPYATIVLKRPLKHALHKKLLDRLKPSKALRSWNGAAELMRRGMDTPAPIAWIEETSGHDLTRNWYICEYVQGKKSVETAFKAISRKRPLELNADKNTLFDALADYLSKLHNRGVHFRDLSSGNILIREHTDKRNASPVFTLIDTARLHAFERQLPLRKRKQDLVRTCFKLSPEERLVFLSTYFGRMGKKVTKSMRIQMGLYDLKVSFKKMLRTWQKARGVSR